MKATSDINGVFEEKTNTLHIDDAKPVADTENETYTVQDAGPDLEFKVTARLILSILVGFSICLLNFNDKISL